MEREGRVLQDSHRFLYRLAGLWLVALLTSVLGASAEDPRIQVRYRTVDTVYLDAGSTVGLAAGQRLEVLRDDRVIAVLEVVFTAQHSASCRVVESSQEIRAGDLVRPTGALEAPTPAPSSTSPLPPTPVEPDVPPEDAAVSSRPRDSYRRAYVPRANRLSGVLAFDWETFSDGGEDGRDLQLSTARLDLRGRRLGGLPLEATVRLRSRRIERDHPLSGGVATSEDSDRLYELSLAWAPATDRWGVEVGRVRLGTYSGTGYLDGAAGQFRVLPGFELGAFYGARPDVRELGLDSEGTAYGLFTRWTPGSGSDAWEVYLSGAREESDAGEERDLVVLETRLGRGDARWSLFQRAEFSVDGSGETAETEGASQLTQLALVLVGNFSETRRVVVSYDRNEPLRPFDEDPDPTSQRFDDLLRQGLRVGLHLGSRQGLNGSVTAGARDGSDLEEATYSLGFGLRHPKVLGVGLGLDVMGYSNPGSDGLLVILRARRGFSGGHSVALALGANAYTQELRDEERVTSWVRMSGWVELPYSLFLRGEAEVSAGDDLEGTRLGLGVGYRF